MMTDNLKNPYADVADTPEGHAKALAWSRENCPNAYLD